MSKEQWLAVARKRAPRLAEVILVADARGGITIYVQDRGWVLILDRGTPVRIDRGRVPSGVRIFTVEEAMNLFRSEDAPLTIAPSSTRPKRERRPPRGAVLPRGCDPQAVVPGTMQHLAFAALCAEDDGGLTREELTRLSSRVKEAVELDIIQPYGEDTPRFFIGKRGMWLLFSLVAVALAVAT